MIHLTSGGTEGGSITLEKTSGTAQKYKVGNSGSAFFIYNETAGNQPLTILNNGTSTFRSPLLTNNPSEGATGEGLIAGQSFKIDGTGTSQTAKMYMVSNTLSNTYGSGLTLQGANFAGDKAFGFNLNTSGSLETYIKNSGGSFARAMTITQAAYVGIGTNSPSSFAAPQLAVVTSSSSNAGISIDNTYTATAAGTASLFLYNNGTLKVRLDYARDLDAGLIGTSASIPMLFYTNGSEKMRLMSEGWLLIKNVASTPAANPSAGGYLFVDSGRLYFRGSSGTITLIANA